MVDEPTEEDRLGFVTSYGVEPVDVNTDLTFKDAATAVAEMTPIIGDAMAAKEVYDELQKEDPNYGLIAALGGAALIGAIPGIGDAAAAGIRKAVDVSKRVEVDPDSVGMMGGNIRIKPKDESVWSYPEQLYDSADTSINVSKKPAGYNELKKRGEIKDGDLIVDIGGGRFDNLVEDAAEEGATVKVYDPFNRTPEHNAAVVDSVRDGQADMAMSHNVLNVIQEDKNIIDIAAQAENALKPNGKAHFSVYEGDGKGVGKVTTKGYQRNEKTQAYVPLIEQVFGKGNVTKRGKIITATKSVKGFSEGGMAMEKQMEMNFSLGGIPENTIGIDPVSGNEIPLGSNAENVRDDIPANLSEGEIVVPADVVNFHGVKLFEDLRAEAKMGYAQMAADGRMGGEPMMEEEDMDIELTIEDLNVIDDEEPVEMAGGGMTAGPRGYARKNNSAAQQAARSMAQAGIRNLSGAGSKNYKAAHNAAVQAQSVRDKNRKDRADRRRAAALAAAKQAAAQQQTSPIVQTNIKQPTAPVPTLGAQINFPGFEDTTVPAPYSPSSKPQPPTAESAPTVDNSSMSAAERVRLLGGNKGNELSSLQKLVKGAREGVDNIVDRFTDDKEKPNTGISKYGSGTTLPNLEGENLRGKSKSFMEVLTAPYRAIVGDDEEDMNEGGLVNPEPFYSQKGGFDLSHMEETGTYVQEYMNDEGHRIYVTFIDGVPQMEIPEGYYPVGPSTNLNTIINSSIPTMDGISPEPVQQRTRVSDRDKSEPPAPTPVNYKELSIDELKAMIADQRTMGSKVFAALSPLTKIIMWDQTRRTKGEIERRIEDPNTSQVDLMRLNNLLELMNREEPGLIKTLLDKVQGKEFERIASQIPKPVLPDVDYSDPTLAPDQGITYTPDAQEESGTKIPNVEPEIPEPYQPEVPGQANLFSDETIEAAKKISQEAAANAFSTPQQKAARTRVEEALSTAAPTEQIMQPDKKERDRRKTALDFSPQATAAARQSAASAATKLGLDPTAKRGGRNKGGLATKKGKKKKSK